MVPGRHQFEFVIRDSFTPDTLPMARLAEYMADLALMLGEKDHVHFVELREGSAAVSYAVDHEAAPKTDERLRAVRNLDDDAEPEAINAYRRIDKRLREDNAHGVLRQVGDDTAQLLVFPGVKAVGDEKYGPFTEHAQLYGIPISVGGKKALVNVNLEDGDRTYYCEADRELALQIAPLMFHHRIRVSGTGRFERDAQGEWTLKSFRIASFERLDERPLGETVGRLRQIARKVGLDRDIVAKLAGLRESR